MTFTCKEARPLIPSYADGELSETQAGFLRKHLLECSSCRLLAQDEKVLKRWFRAPAAPEVPADFAARVVRRAFAGDTGERAVTASAAASAEAGRLREFVSTLTALAAAAAILIVVAIRQSDLPDERDLRADELKSFDEIRQELIELNEAARTEDGEEEPEGADGERGR